MITDVWPELSPPLDQPDPLVDRLKLLAIAMLVGLVAALLLTGPPAGPVTLNTRSGGVHEIAPPTAVPTLVR